MTSLRVTTLRAIALAAITCAGGCDLWARFRTGPATEAGSSPAPDLEASTPLPSDSDVPRLDLSTDANTVDCNPRTHPLAPITELGDAHVDGATFDPRNGHLYVAGDRRVGPGRVQLVIAELDACGQPVGPVVQQDLPPGATAAHPHDVVVTAGGTHLCVAGEYTNAAGTHGWLRCLKLALSGRVLTTGSWQRLSSESRRTYIADASGQLLAVSAQTKAQGVLQRSLYTYDGKATLLPDPNADVADVEVGDLQRVGNAIHLGYRYGATTLAHEQLPGNCRANACVPLAVRRDGSSLATLQRFTPGATYSIWIGTLSGEYIALGANSGPSRSELSFGAGYEIFRARTLSGRTLVAGHDGQGDALLGRISSDLSTYTAAPRRGVSGEIVAIVPLSGQRMALVANVGGGQLEICDATKCLAPSP